MSSATKADKKAAVDAAACMFNVVTSVGIIIVNKALMAIYGFSFATTLIGMHFGTTTILTVFLRWMGYIQTSHLPSSELLRFVLFANFSIVGMWSSVGFYKLSWTRCGFEDVSVNTQGFIAAFIVVWSTAMQQYYVHYLQRKYALGSFNLLGHTAPAQAASLLLLGPFLDYWLTSKRVDAYNYGFASVFFIVLSCSIVVGTNLSQFICIGRFTAVSFQVLGHMKTILVLILGFIFFGKDGLKWHVILGMVIAIVGMIWYGNASSKSGGKERCNLSMPSKNAQNNAGLPESTESDEKV